jgi:hypothetical protein
MACACRIALVAAVFVPSLAHGAGFRTRNFVVDAPSAQAARAVGERAEIYRKSIALAWLGRELPAWTKACPIHVKLTGGEAGGVTTFDFDPQRKGVSDQVITVEGSLERILASALPHEITHTIFAAFFGGPMPRWADEGASLLSEDLRELKRQDQIVATLLSRKGDMTLVELFRQEEYPPDLLGFYGQGYSVSRFLIEIGGRPRFLQFVRDGQGASWDEAARRHYGLANARELDRAWRAWYTVAIRQSGGGDPPLIARAQSPERSSE